MKQSQKYPYKECLTNEALLKQGQESQFEIVNRAIKVADHLVKSGKAQDFKSDNVAYDVLSKMADEGLSVFHDEIEE